MSTLHCKENTEWLQRKLLLCLPWRLYSSQATNDKADSSHMTQPAPDRCYTRMLRFLYLYWLDY